jgi:hypothetical protein
MACRVTVRDRALADVGDDLALVTDAAGNIGTRRKTALVERFERPEAIGKVIGSIRRIEGAPDLPLEASVVMAFSGQAEADHRRSWSLQKPDRMIRPADPCIYRSNTSHSFQDEASCPSF